MSPRTWRRAWSDAARRFWASEEPHRHFTTSTSAALADRIAVLVHEIDARLDHPDSLTVVDVGCGDGSLLALVRERCADLRSRARWIGIDVRPGSTDGVEHVVARVPCALPLGPVDGLVMAHEWLDEIPCDVVARDDAGVDRIVLVDESGDESLGPALDDDEGCARHDVDAARARAWLDRWWPLHDPGDRAEIGAPRDAAWAWMAGLLASGTALATDYGHTRPERIAHHRVGTLTGYRHGRVVRPVPDGQVNLTAHVALDSCVAALTGTTLTRQRDELAVLPLAQEPSVADVERHFASLRLRDPARLGGVGWLRWDAHRGPQPPASTLPMW